MQDRAGMTVRFQLAAISVGLVCLVWAVFGRTVGHDFIGYDDALYLTDNPHVRGGLTWDGVRWAATSLEYANWHPATWWSHMVDVELFGLEWPGGHHAVSVGLHAASAVLLFFVLFAMTRGRRRRRNSRSKEWRENGRRRRRMPAHSMWAAALVAGLFAVHPLHVESVAWAAERKDTLSTLCWMATMGGYVWWAQRGGVWRYVAMCCAFAVGLMSKPMLVTLPAVLVLVDYWPLGRWSRVGGWRCVTEKWPLWLMACASAAVTYAAQQRSGAVESVERLALPVRLANAVYSYGWYLWKTICPTGLAIFYPHPEEQLWKDGWMAAGLVTAAVVLAAVTRAVWRRRSEAPWLLVGWLWFVGTAVPVIGLVQVGRQGMADRYTYVPLVGVFLMVAYSLESLVRSTPRWRNAVVAGCCAAVTACGATAWVQTGHWRDQIAVFQRAASVTEGNVVAHNNLGLAYLKTGRNDDATRQFELAFAAGPTNAKVRYNLGGQRLRAGNLKAAKEHFAAAVQLGSDASAALAGLGTVAMREGRYAEALALYDDAIAEKPDSGGFRMGRVNALYHLGEVAAAERELSELVGAGFSRASASLKLARMRRELGDVEGAVAAAEQAARDAPTDGRPRLLMAEILAARGDDVGAVRAIQEAVSLRPKDAAAWVFLGQRLEAMGNLAAAMRSYRTALCLDGGQLLAANNLAWLLATAEDGALRNGEEAIRLAVACREATGAGAFQILDTLAAAHAERGEFEEAMQVASAAMSMAREAGEMDEAAAIEARMVLYARGEPYRTR